MRLSEDLLLQRRILFLATAIGEDEARELTMSLVLLDHHSPGDVIDLYINSPGGNVYDMFAIYDAMLAIESPIATFAFTAMSAAALLLAAGTPGMRRISANGCVMLHRSEIGARPGRSDELSSFAQHSMALEDRYVDLLAAHCNKPSQEIRADCAGGRWLDAPDVCAYGIADHIISRKPA